MTRRMLAIVLLLAAVVGVVAIDRIGVSTPAGEVAFGRLQPAVAPADVPSSSFFCAAGSAEGPGGVAEQVLQITNTSTEPRIANVTASGNDGAQATRTVELPAQTRVPLRASELITASWAGVLVEVDGGGVAVDHTLTGPFGSTAGPCASSASTTWFFPAGATLLGVRDLLVLFNPYAERAVVDVVAATDDGSRTPNSFSGLVVEARSVRVVDVAEEVTVREQVALDVRTRTGLVVAERLEIVTSGSETLPPSLNVSLGAPATQPAWYFPLGTPLAEGVTQSFVVYNPSESLADVDIQPLVDDPATNGFVEPFAVSIRPGQYVVLNLADDGRVPAGVGVGAYVETRNDVPVVAARVVRVTAEAGGSSGAGTSISLGSPLVGTTWVVPLGATRGFGGANIGISNLGLRDAEVTVTLLVDGEATTLGDSPRTVRAGNRLQIDVGEVADASKVSILVTSTQPIAVERGVRFPSSGGLAIAPAFVAVDGAEVPGVAVPDDSTSPTVILDGSVTTSTAPPETAPPATDETGPTVTTGEATAAAGGAG